MNSDLLFESAHNLAARIRKREVKAVEVVRAALSQIDRLNGRLNAFLTVNENAEAQAQAIDQRLDKGEAVGPLGGVPIGIKDLLCTKGIKTTAASKILHNFIPPYSATVVERLERAGGITIGKCNLDEFAMGSSNENSAFGPVRNPWSFAHVPGGSSGGSAAAVASGMVPIAVGTDTGGSIRQPANLSGTVGIKPTYGRVSRYGIIAFASSLDQAGPMSRTVKDSALALEAMAGHDPHDATTAQRPSEPWAERLNANLKGIKIGLPKEYFSDQLHPDTRAVVEKSIAFVKDAGAQTVEVSLPLIRVGIPIYYLIATSEASSNLARYDGVRFGHRADFSRSPATDLEEFYARTRGEGFGSEVKRRIILGTYALSSGYYDAFYRKASQVRRLLREEFLQAFNKCDVLLTPVTTAPAFKLGERVSNPLEMYLNDIFTISNNLVGIPGLSVPGGLSKERLPIGVQLSAPHFEEQRLFNVAQAIEERAQLWQEVPDGIR